ncbi:MAG: hypothetical protein ACOZIN_16610 [Myxococcota bacterium]
MRAIILTLLTIFLVHAALLFWAQPVAINGSRRSTAPRPPPVPTALEGERLARLLGMRLSSTERPASVPPRAPLSARVLGTLVSAEPRWSFVLVDDGGKTRTVAVGDQLEGADVLSIERRRVSVLRDGREEWLELGAPAGAGTSLPALGENRFTLLRTTVEQALDELPHHGAQVMLVPAFEQGKAVGIKLFGLRAGSIWERLGLRNGDVLRQVNGVELSNPRRALDLYAQAGTLREVTLEVLREGRINVLTYLIE